MSKKNYDEKLRDAIDRQVLNLMEGDETQSPAIIQAAIKWYKDRQGPAAAAKDQANPVEEALQRISAAHAAGGPLPPPPTEEELNDNQ